MSIEARLDGIHIPFKKRPKDRKDLKQEKEIIRFNTHLSDLALADMLNLPLAFVRVQKTLGDEYRKKIMQARNAHRKTIFRSRHGGPLKKIII